MAAWVSAMRAMPSMMGPMVVEPLVPHDFSFVFPSSGDICPDKKHEVSFHQISMVLVHIE
jgi:hypothetical protein